MVTPDCEYKVTKIINALQAFFQFIPNYFLFSHSLIFVKIAPLLIIASRNNNLCSSVWSVWPPFCRAKHFCVFCVFCVNTNRNVKQFQNDYFRPKIPVFQSFSASWTFLRGNSDFPLTKLPLSPNETFRFPRVLSTPCFSRLYYVKSFPFLLLTVLRNYAITQLHLRSTIFLFQSEYILYYYIYYNIYNNIIFNLSQMSQRIST